MTDHVRFYRRPSQVVRANLRVFVINAIVFGFFIAGLFAAMIFPGL